MRDSPNRRIDINELTKQDPLILSPKRFTRIFESVNGGEIKDRSRSTSPTPRKRQRLIKSPTFKGQAKVLGEPVVSPTNVRVTPNEVNAWNDLFDNLNEKKVNRLDFIEKLNSDLVRAVAGEEAGVTGLVEGVLEGSIGTNVVELDLTEWERHEAKDEEWGIIKPTPGPVACLNHAVSVGPEKNTYGGVRSFLQDENSSASSSDSEMEDLDEAPKSISDLKSIGKRNRDMEEFKYFLETIRLSKESGSNLDVTNQQLILSLSDICKDFSNGTQMVIPWKRDYSTLEKTTRRLYEIWNEIVLQSEGCATVVESMIILTMMCMFDQVRNLIDGLPHTFILNRLHNVVVLSTTHPSPRYKKLVDETFLAVGIDPENLVEALTKKMEKVG